MITRTEAVTVVVVLAAMGAAVPAALSSPLLPGQTSPAAAEIEPVGGMTIAFSGAVSFAGATFAGTLSSSVISGDMTNPYGGLTFTYFVTNSMASADAITRLTLTPFTGFATDVSFQPAPAPAALPTFVDRSVSGSVVGFDFIGSPVPLIPGSPSVLLVVQTNAPGYTNGGIASVIDGSAITGILTYIPIPEPATLATLAMGIAGILVGRCRQA